MPHFSHVILGGALTAALTFPAGAQTLAQDIWTEWQQLSESSGQALTAEVVPTDTGLRLLNFTTVTEDPEVSVTGVMAEIEMIENADGTLDVVFSENYDMTMTFNVAPDIPPAVIELLMTHENLALQVSGDPGARVYVYSADQIDIRNGEISGGDGEPPDVDVDITLRDLASTYRIFGDSPESLQFSSTASLASGTIIAEINGPPDDPGNAKMGMVFSDIVSNSAGSIVNPAALSQLGDTLPEDFELGVQTSYGNFDMELAFDIPDDAVFETIYSNGGGSARFALSNTGMDVEFQTTDMRMRVAGQDIPVPIEIAAASTGMELDVPLAAGDTPQDVAARIAYEDVTMADALWGMFDPGAAIPRDPASVIFDATAQVQIFVDLMSIDPETLQAPPGELRALTVNEMRVAIGGAELTGTADLDFAPGQLVPMPAGQADIQLSGGNALLDALIAGGLVPADQGAFVRGMTNVFARPGAAPDTLETTVEFGADGSITANGVPLQ